MQSFRLSLELGLSDLMMPIRKCSVTPDFTDPFFYDDGCKKAEHAPPSSSDIMVRVSNALTSMMSNNGAWSLHSHALDHMSV